MSATSAIAVIGAVATPTVAIAGYVFTARSRGEDRQATRELASEGHEHERKLAAITRAYDDKRSAYLTTPRYALNTIQRISLTHPILGFGDQPIPDEIPQAEWDGMHVAIAAFGSRDVDEALKVFLEASRDFFYAAHTFSALQAAGRDAVDDRHAMEDARTKASDAFMALRKAVNDDLATS